MLQRLVLSTLATLLLGGCGHRGPLVYPPKAATPPAVVSPASTPAPASDASTATGAADSNTTGDPAR